MSLIWSAISMVICLEMVVLLALCAPLPWGVRKYISRWIVRMKAEQRTNTLLQYVWFGLTVALVESINSLRVVYSYISQQEQAQQQHLSDEDHHEVPNTNSLFHHEVSLPLRKAAAERNIYLVAFGLTAMFAIRRLVQLATIEMKLRRKIKQYNGNKPITETGEVNYSVPPSEPCSPCSPTSDSSSLLESWLSSASTEDRRDDTKQN